MPHLKTRCILPYRIEVKEYHSSRYHGKKVTPAPRTKKTTEEMVKVNERNRIKKLYWIIATNFDFGDLHMQLTYRREERPTPEGARKSLKKFFRRLRKEYKKRGKELKYIVTTEYKRTAIHHHLVLNEIGDTAKTVNRIWEKGKAFFTVIYEDGEVEDLAAYLIKETQNSFRDPDNPSKLSYSCSRNLKKPNIKTKIIKSDTWRKTPKPPKGYYLDKGSIVEGVSKVTGYPYQYYTFKKIKEDKHERKNHKGRVPPNKANEPGRNGTIYKSMPSDGARRKRTN